MTINPPANVVFDTQSDVQNLAEVARGEINARNMPPASSVVAQVSPEDACKLSAWIVQGKP